MKIKMLHPKTAVPFITISPKSKLARSATAIKILQRCHIVRDNRTGDLALAPTYAWPYGYGRSLRAIVLGLEYKNAVRIAGGPMEFSHEMFNLPQGDAGYRAALIKAGVKQKGAR